MSIPDDPVLSVEDARSHLHAIVSAAGEGREFLIGPRRRPVARVIPAVAGTPPQGGPEAGVTISLAGDAAESLLALAGDALGFALAEEHAVHGALRVPEGGAAVVAALGDNASDVLAEAALVSFHAAGGDPMVTRQTLRAAISA